MGRGQHQAVQAMSWLVSLTCYGGEHRLSGAGKKEKSIAMAFIEHISLMESSPHLPLLIVNLMILGV